MTNSAGIEKILLSVKEAADAISISPWSMYKLLDAGAVESRYHGRKRLVVAESLREYAANLPTVPAEASA